MNIDESTAFIIKERSIEILRLKKKANIELSITDMIDIVIKETIFYLLSKDKLKKKIYTDIAKLWADPSISSYEIGKRLGLNAGYVRAIAKRLKLPKRPYGRYLPKTDVKTGAM